MNAAGKAVEGSSKIDSSAHDACFKAPIYLNTGSAGNIEVCHGWLEPRPSWSHGLRGGAYEFGFATLEASAKALWMEYVRASDGRVVDSFTLER